ncbi:GNAT family N-acetyltransferase [Pseudobacteriovorax antillogorgiicola]|uniref:Putative acetyltransferase n=1 Tax=Pseudobacteriovorax antillogorgiicola TaxID=1513793 RepID=A0A1Y6C8Y8_9BACT|nr:GNAT family N-acetyltransferase [Pseudobacteriovorax antillogorgiicola]TCS49801.1 putative acetyltransferase [Pseudobacteriovorax antillogorgiicola]SMF43040.1 putative acetyltransferase [Pseudobacteriovorax antillogorgiicola]
MEIQRTFRLRPIEESDNDAMAEIIKQCAHEFDLIGPGYGPTDEEVDHLFQAYHGLGRAYWLAESPDKILGGAGIAGLEGESQLWCELRKMYVLPAGRGLGIGFSLLQQLMIEAYDFGFRYCYLETTGALVQAKELYLKAGFKILEEPMGQTGHTRCEIPMALDIGLFLANPP